MWGWVDMNIMKGAATGVAIGTVVASGIFLYWERESVMNWWRGSKTTNEVEGYTEPIDNTDKVEADITEKAADLEPQVTEVEAQGDAAGGGKDDEEQEKENFCGFKKGFLLT